jgi:phosphoribosylamine--glycine ligase
VNGASIRKGDKITQGFLAKDCFFFPAGVSVNSVGDLVTAGGRVCGLTALGTSLSTAREQAYRNLSQISFFGMQFRQDIGAKYL